MFEEHEEGHTQVAVPFITSHFAKKSHVLFSHGLDVVVTAVVVVAPPEKDTMLVLSYSLVVKA